MKKFNKDQEPLLTEVVAMATIALAIETIDNALASLNPIEHVNLRFSMESVKAAYTDAMKETRERTIE
jgi:hypothetical protein